MNVSKINIFNVKRQGVSPFGGDTPAVVSNRELWEQQEERSKKATKFLKSAGVVSAAILAVAYAGRAGVFRNLGQKKVKEEVVKPVVEEVTETIEEIFAKKVIKLTSLQGVWSSLDKKIEIVEGGTVISNTGEPKPYTEWKILNGKLILTPDTFDVYALGPDSLYLENNNGIYGYKRMLKQSAKAKNTRTVQ